MDKNKLSKMIDGIDDKYLQDSEQILPKTENGFVGKAAFFVVAAICIAAIGGAVILKLNKIKSDSSKDSVVAVAATSSSVYGSQETTDEVPLQSTQSDCMFFNFPSLTELASRQDPYISDFNGMKTEELINYYGTPQKINNTYYWTAEVDGDVRYITYTEENGIIDGVYHTIPTYVVVIDAKNNLFYHSWTPDANDTTHLVYGFSEDIFGNSIEPKNGYQYKFQSNGTVEESLPGYISQPFSITEMGAVSEEQFNYLREDYRKFENMPLSYSFGSYSTAKTVYRSLASSHAGDTTISASNVFTMDDELFRFSGTPFMINVENPVYTRLYIYDESNNYGCKGTYLDSEKEELKKIFNGDYCVYKVEGVNDIRIIVSNGNLYIDTGIVYGIYKIEK